MKIFAKRKKRSNNPATSEEKKTEHKSDPVVEELLKKDPSEWNAKERRMVKRHQRRKKEEGSSDVEDISENKSNEKDTEMSYKEVSETNFATDDTKNEIDDDSSSTSNGSDGSSSDYEYVSGFKKAAEQETSTKDSNVATAKETEEFGADNKEDDEKNIVNKDHAIWKILNKLNSKHKRTLSRKLDRQGAIVLAEVEIEAKQLLGEGGDTSDDKEKAPANDADPDPAAEPPNAKKRKKEADWSSLTPEERLRREEQRRKQKEAGERRMRGEDIKPGHKRPLNSARRRANRRKPKWKKPSSEVKNEHNSSGYVHRKHGGQEYTQAAA
jgi:hypothetical protein